MAITPHFTIFIATFLLLCASTLAAPASDAIPTIKAPEIETMSPYFTQLMQSIPILPPPENAASLAASRKVIEDAIVAFNLNYSRLTLGEEEVTPTEHRICETSGISPNFADAVAAASTIWNRGGRCKMTRRCTEFATWGEAAIGACAGGFQLWDFDCRTMWHWITGICFGCSTKFGETYRTGGKFMFDDGSGSDVRVYRN